GRIDEDFGFDQAAGGASPARERLETDDLAAVEVDQGLEEGHELAGLDAGANILFQLQPFLDLAFELLVEPGESAPSRALGRIERNIAFAQCRLLVFRSAQPG